MGALSTAICPEPRLMHDRDSSSFDLSKSRRLVVIGMGMAAYGLVDRLSKRDAFSAFEVTLIGDEPTLPYDRVNLSKLFDGATESELSLASKQWYEDRKSTSSVVNESLGLTEVKKAFVQLMARRMGTTSWSLQPDRAPGCLRSTEPIETECLSIEHLAISLRSKSMCRM